MMKHRCPFIFFGLLLCLVLAACGGSDAPAAAPAASPASTNPPAGPPLVIWGPHDLTDAENPPSLLMQQRIDDFSAATGIPVEYEQIAWNQLAPKLALAVQSGGAVPDLVEAGSQHIPALLSAGALMELDGLFADAPWLADMNENDTAACVRNGTRYCVSNLVRSSLTYYRQSAFPDGFPTTSTGWLDAGPRLQQDGLFLSTFRADKEYATVELTWGQWIYSNGGRIFDDEGRPAWVSPETVEVIAFGRQLFGAGNLPEATLTGDFAAAEAPWIDGSAASFRGGTWSLLFVPGLEEAVTAGDVGIAGGLSFNGNPPTIFITGENWVVPAGAANPAGAAQWINGFMQPDFLAEWGAAQVGIPTLRSALNADIFADDFYRGASELMAGQGRFIEQSPYYVESLSTLALAIQELLLDPTLDIEARLTEAQDEVLTRYWR